MKRLKKTIILFWTLLPYINLPIVIWQLSIGINRVSSFTGNPILLAGESFFSFFIGMRMLQTKQGEQSLYYLFSTIFAMICLLFAVTHAAYLALIVSFITYWYGYITFKRQA